MKGEYLLHAVWSAELCSGNDFRRSPIAATLRRLLSRPVIHLVTSAFGKDPYATYASVLVEDGLSLADVLEQELDVTVNDGDVVLIEPRSYVEDWRYSQAELGDHISKLLVGLAATDLSDREKFRRTGFAVLDQAIRGQLSKEFPEARSHLN